MYRVQCLQVLQRRNDTWRKSCGDRPATGWEAIAIMHKAGGRMRWNGGGLPATFIYPKAIASKASDGTTHATEKPQALLQRLLCLFTDKGDTILDPFGGSGATAIAAHALGRRCVIVECERRYCDLIAERAEAAADAPIIEAIEGEQQAWI